MYTMLSTTYPVATVDYTHVGLATAFFEDNAQENTRADILVED